MNHDQIKHHVTCPINVYLHLILLQFNAEMEDKIKSEKHIKVMKYFPPSGMVNLLNTAYCGNNWQ